jgi:hypothetical protein
LWIGLNLLDSAETFRCHLDRTARGRRRE